MKWRCNNIQGFNKIRDRIISKFKPSTGGNLIGMEDDLDYYLYDLDLFKKYDYKITKNKNVLLVAKCKLKPQVDIKRHLEYN